MYTNGFWEELYGRGEPVLGLSPMDGVTDAAFRAMVLKYSGTQNKSSEPRNPRGVDVIFTEFVSVDGLHFAEGVKRERILKDFIKARDLLRYTGAEYFAQKNGMSEPVGASEQLPASSRQGGSGQPEETLRAENHLAQQCQSQQTYEVAQVFGNKPELFVEAAKLVESLGFDGIDINMGCPAKNVSENGCGAGLIRTPELAQNIVRATQAATKLPVSVKTRIGVSSGSEMEEWMAAICEVRPANISLHGRTLKQLYQGSADWEAIGRAAEIVHQAGLHILGNGDVISILDAKEKIQTYGVDGVLIGRAVQGNPELFRQCAQICKCTPMCTNEAPTREQKLAWAVEHAMLYERVFQPTIVDPTDNRWFLPMRKHLAWYAHGFPGAVELRMALMKTGSAEDVTRVIDDFLKS